MTIGEPGPGAREPGRTAHATRPESRTPEPGPVAHLADIPADGLLGVTLADGTPVCLVRHEGHVCALHDRCTHAEYSLSAGELLPDGSIQCLWHGAIFDCRSGEVRRGPATDAVRTYAVRVEGGAVWVDGTTGNEEPGTDAAPDSRRPTQQV